MDFWTLVNAAASGLLIGLVYGLSALGLSVIALNLGMYVAAPAIIIYKTRKVVPIHKWKRGEGNLA